MADARGPHGIPLVTVLHRLSDAVNEGLMAEYEVLAYDEGHAEADSVIAALEDTERELSALLGLIALAREQYAKDRERIVTKERRKENG